MSHGFNGLAEPEAMIDKNWILVGVAGAPHGVRGELRLKSYTETPLGIAAYATIWAGEPPLRRLTFASARLLKDDMLVVRFQGVEAREAAQALKNTKLFVARADLPPVKEDEFYHADLIGLDALGPDGARLGFVSALENFGAGDLLEITPPRGDSFYVPFTRAFVPVVDLSTQRIVLAAEAVQAGDSEKEENVADQT